jgi:hypothetical protein
MSVGLALIAEQVWQRSDPSGADLPGRLEADFPPALKSPLEFNLPTCPALRPQSLAKLATSRLLNNVTCRWLKTTDAVQCPPFG